MGENMILFDVNSFKITQPINLAEIKSFQTGIDLQKLKKQHENFVKILNRENKLGDLTDLETVEVLASNSECPEQVFVRDVAFKVGKIREKEAEIFAKYLKRKEISYYKFKSKIEGGDVIVYNQTIFVGIGTRTKNSAIDEISKIFKDYRIVPIKLTKDMLHLDCVFNIVNAGCAVVYPGGITKESYKLISKIFRLIEISKEEQESLATNFLKTEGVIFCEKTNKRVNSLIANEGERIIEVEFDEFHKLGGSLRCCVLDYNINNYISKRYLSYRNKKLYYKDINLYSLVSKFGNPLKVGYPGIIKEKIEGLNYAFNFAIANKNYKGKYFYANADKASYYAENVITAGTYADFIETSSMPDLAIVERIMSKNIVKKKKIICNGIKDKEYIEQIFRMVDDGYQILNIIDNVGEFEQILKHPFKNKLEIGLRVKLESIYAKDPKIAKYERFGLYNDEIDYILREYKKNPKLHLTTIHYHQRGSVFDKNKFLRSLTSAFKVYAHVAKIDKNVKTFNIGGGCPYDKIEEHNYQNFVDLVIDKLKSLSTEMDVDEPNIIQENGRYTVSDSCFNIYKITNTKKDDKRRLEWTGFLPWSDSIRW